MEAPLLQRQTMCPRQQDGEMKILEAMRNVMQRVMIRRATARSSGRVFSGTQALWLVCTSLSQCCKATDFNTIDIGLHCSNHKTWGGVSRAKVFDWCLFYVCSRGSAWKVLTRSSRFHILNVRRACSWLLVKHMIWSDATLTVAGSSL